MFPLFRSLRFRLFGLVVLALLPALGFILSHAHEQQNQIMIEAQADAVHLAKQSALQLEQMIGGVRQLAVALAQIAQVMDMPDFRKAHLLENLLRQYPYYHILGIVNVDGSLAYSAPPAPSHPSLNFTDRPWFQKVTQTRRFFVSDLQISRVAPGKKDLVFAQPIINPQDELVGVAGVSLNLEWLSEMAALADLPPGAVMLVIDRQGNILARTSESAKWVGRQAPEFPLIKTILQQQEGVVQEAGLDEVPRLYAFVPVHRQKGAPEPDAAMYVAVGIPTAMAIAEVNRGLGRNLSFVGIISLLIVILTWWGTKVLVLKPVQVLAGAATQLAAGDLSTRTHLTGTPDEINRLAITFDNMAETMQQQEVERERAASRLAILNRLYLLRSRINEVMVRVRQPQELYEQVVRIAVEEGGFRMAWMGEVDPLTNRVIPAAQGGHVNGYLDGIVISTLDVPEGRGPTGTAAREGRAVIVNDWEKAPQVTVWMESGVKRGYHSSAALPLHLDNRVVAVLSLYSEHPNFFTSEESALLTALSDDLSFALEAMAQEKQRQEAEERLKNQMEFVTTLLETIPSPVFYKDVFGRYLGCNRAFEEFFGKARKQIIGKEVHEMGPPEIAEKYATMDQALFAQPGSQKYEWKVKVGEDQERDAIFHKATFMDTSGEVAGLIGVIQDITELKQREEALRQSEENFRALYNRTPVMLHSINQEGEVVSVSDYWLEVMGYDREEVLGRHISDFMTAASRREMLEVRFPKFLETGRARDLEYQWVKKNGEIMDVLVSAILDRDETGRILRSMGVVVDVTARKRAEEALQAASRNWQTTFNAMGDGITLLDRRSQIVQANQAFLDLVEKPAAEVEGRHCWELVHGRAAPIPECPVARMWQSRRRETLELALGDRWFLVSADPIMDEAGAVTGGVHILNDITVRKQAERDLLESKNILQKTFDALDEGVFLVDPATRNIVGCNPTAGRMFGYGIEELIGRNFLFLHVNREFYEEYGRRMFRELDKTGIFRTEFQMKRRDGVIFPTDNTVTQLLDEGGSRTLLVGTMRDISERRAAEEALRESEERMRLFIEHAPAALAMFDKEMRYLSVSRRWLRDYGLGDRDLFGLSHYEVFPEIPESWKEVHRRGLAGEVVGAEADSFERLDGSVQWLRWEVRPWYDASGGGVGGIVIFTEDITARQQAEEALQASEALLRDAQRIAHMGSWSVNIADNTFTWSEEMYRIYGVTKKELPHTMDVFMKLLHPDDRHLMERWVEQTIAQLKPGELDFRVVLPDGTIRYIRGEGDLITDQTGKPERMVGTAQDITARKRLEEERDRLFNLSLDMLCIAGFDGFFKQLNPAWSKTLGWTEEELLSKSWLEFVHPEDRQATIAAGEKLLDGRAVYGFENRYLCLGGSHRWLSWNSFPLPDEGLIFCVVRDVTTQRLAEEALLREKHFTDAAIESLPGVFYLFSAAGKYLRWNANLEQVTGYTGADFAGMLPWDLFKGPERERTAAAFQEALKRGDVTIEAELAAKDGSQIPYLFTGRRVKLDDRTCVLGMGIDISARKQAEAALQESEERLRLAVESSDTGLWDWDLITNQVYFSPEWKRQLGYKDHEIPNLFEEWESRLHPEDHDRAVATVQAYLENPWPDYEMEFRLRHRDSSYRWILTRAALYSDQTGRPVRMMGSHLDITRRKMIEKQLAEAGDQLRGLAARLAESEDAERKRIARELHDQVGQNLTALSINLNLINSLLPGEATEQARSRLDNSMALVQQTGKVIRNLMAELRPPVLDDYGLVAALRWYAGEFATWSGIDVEVHGEELTTRLEPNIENVLFRIYQEALTNAVKHSQASQAVVTLEKDGTTVRMIIEDNGVGFHPAQLRKPEGDQGWGLLTMHERALTVGGRCRIESSPGEGTRVIVEVNR